MWIQRALAPVLAIALCLWPLPANGSTRETRLTPTRLYSLGSFLTEAERVRVTLVDGRCLEGKVEVVDANTIAIRVWSSGRRSSAVMAVLPTTEVQQLLVRHVRTNNPGLLRKLGAAIGFAAGVPVVSYAANAGTGAGAWMALVGFPVLGVIAGDRLARDVQETRIVIETDDSTGE